MKSRLFIAIVSILLAFGITGCGDDEPAAEPGGSTPDDGFRDLGYSPDVTDVTEDAPAVDTAEVAVVTEICDNDLDDDMDTAIDCDDSDCTGDPACTADVETDCDNDLDDDGDSRIDCNDTDCAEDPVCLDEPTDEICDNEIDDDQDGLTDCFDGDCAADEACMPDVAEICDNSIDDDEDGATDCDDADCLSFCTDGGTGGGDMEGDMLLCILMCLIDPDPMTCMMGCFGAGGGMFETNCTDGLDNDGNGMTDCDDPMYCATAPECA